VERHPGEDQSPGARGADIDSVSIAAAPDRPGAEGRAHGEHRLMRLPHLPEQHQPRTAHLAVPMQR